MFDPVDDNIERSTIFVLAGLLLAAIVSIAFFNLDSHPAFPPPTDELIDGLNAVDSPIVFASDSVSLGVLEARQDDLEPTIRPTTSWPPVGPVLIFGAIPSELSSEDFEQLYQESVWSVWIPTKPSPIPIFEMATVEVVDREGQSRVCPRDAEGAHQCGDAGWTRVRPRQTTVDAQRVECIWSHPLEGKTLRIRFPGVTTVGPDGERLRLKTGLRDQAVGDGGSVDFEAQIAGHTNSHRHTDRRGWQSTTLPGVTDPHELVVEVSASDVGRRHVCFRFDLP